MTIINNAYVDASLTTPFDSAVHTLDATAIQGSDGDGSFWFGTPNALNHVQDSTDPGIAAMTVSILDLDAGVADVDVVDIKLALSQAALDAAVAGDPLSLGATVLGGTGNAVRVWYRWANDTGQGTYTDIELVISDRIEAAI